MNVGKNIWRRLFLVGREVAKADLAEINAGQALRVVRGGVEYFKTSSGRIWGRHGSALYPAKGPGVISNVARWEYNLITVARKNPASAESQILGRVRAGKMLPVDAKRLRRIIKVIQDITNGK